MHGRIIFVLSSGRTSIHQFCGPEVGTFGATVLVLVGSGAGQCATQTDALVIQGLDCFSVELFLAAGQLSEKQSSDRLLFMPFLIEVLPDVQMGPGSVSDETYYFPFLLTHVLLRSACTHVRRTLRVALRGGSPPMLIDHCGANVEAKDGAQWCAVAMCIGYAILFS